MNQTIQQSKFDPKGKAITALILGIISGFPIITFVLLVEFLHFIPPMTPMPILNVIFFPILPLIAIVGLIFGILSLKSTKRNFAIVGIVLCLIGLLVPLYYFLFA